MKKRRKSSGFTLLEIIIVIIIVGVLASLALPRFFSTIEYSRSTEALTAMTTIRQALERCYLMKNGTYIGCNSFSTLDIEDPSTSPNAHFTYTVTSQSATGYLITATRNTRDNGDGASTINLTQTATVVTRTGTGDFSGIQ